MSTRGNPTGETSEVRSARRITAARLERALVILVFGLAAAFYYFTVQSTGNLRTQGVLGDYYNLLVDGFRSGHLHLPVQPDPRLVALPDPYDPRLNHEFRLADASYYKGRYFIYFGPTPALVLMLPYTLATGEHLPQAAAVLVFCLVAIGTASSVWLAIRRRYFPASAWWVAPLGVALICFGTHVLALARRPMFWELPIAAGLAFAMLALAAAYAAMHGRRPITAMVLAALCLGLAVGARPTLLLSAGLLLVPAWYLRRCRHDGTWLRAGAAAAVAFALMLGALAWYNYARFESPLEFGQHYQLTSIDERTAVHYSPRFLRYNLRSYFTWSVNWTSDWPFIASRPLAGGPTGHFHGEELYCLALLAPFLWLALVSLAAWRRNGTVVRPGFGAAVIAIGSVSLPPAFVILTFFYAAERYMADFVPGLMLLALCGGLSLEAMARETRWRPVVQSVLLVAAAVTVTTGVLASFDYHGRSMKQSAPETWQAIARGVESPVHRMVRWFQADRRPQ